jgi:hypothetical protein
MPVNPEGQRDIESRILDFVARGEMLDLVGGGSVDESAKRSWGASSTVPAGVIRKVLGGRSAPPPDPKGLRLRGARISGRLDLENLTTNVWLELEDCFLPEGLLARDANLPGLSLAGCLLEHPSEPPLDAARIHISSFLSLPETVVNANAEDGAIVLAGARIEGELDFVAGKIRNESGPALSADGLQVHMDLLLESEFEAIGSGENGAVNLRGARLGGDLSILGGKVRNESGPALYADGLHVERDLLLMEGFEAVGADDDAAVRLAHAHVRGVLALSGGKIRNESGPALDADGVQVDVDALLQSDFEALGAGESGAVTMRGARVNGDLSFLGGKVRNETGPALYADGLHVGGDLLLMEEFEAIGAGDHAALILSHAHIGGRLECATGKLRNDSGPAMYADGLQVDRDFLLVDGFEVIGTSEYAVVVLTHGHVGGRLNFSGGRIRNHAGPALNADGLEVHMDIFMRDEFEAHADSTEAGVRLRGGRVAGDFDCSGAKMHNRSGPALDVDTLRVGRNAFLRHDFEAVGATAGPVVNLAEMHVAGVVVIEPWGVANHANPQGLFSIDGLTYSGTPEGLGSADEWLELLRRGTPGYAAQPYQQLAGAYRTVGQDGDVRKVLMEQRRHQVRSGAMSGRAARAWAQLTGITLGYGYQPWRALIGLLAVVVLGVFLSLFSPDDALAHPTGSTTPGAACSPVERIGVGLDTALPLIKTSAGARCEATATPAGNRVTVAGWVLQVLAWACATLFIAGFTGAVRKT